MKAITNTKKERAHDRKLEAELQILVNIVFALDNSLFQTLQNHWTTAELNKTWFSKETFHCKTTPFSSK